MSLQINGKTVLNTSRVFTGLNGYSTNVSNLGNQVGDGTTNMNLDNGSCFLINFTTAHTSTKTLAFTAIPSTSFEAIIFVTSSTGDASAPGVLNITASGWTQRTTNGTGFYKPINGQQDAYVCWFFAPTLEFYVSYAMRNIS